MAEYTIGPVACTATDPGTGLHEFSGRVILNTTTDAANNATIINSWRFEIYITRQAYISHYSYQNNNRCTVVINGQTLVSSSNIMAVAMEGRYESGNPGPLVLCSGSNITVPHNSDGTKSLAVSANYTQTGSGNYIGTLAPSGTVTLETIARADVISTAPALTLAGTGETNHTVSWTNSSSTYHKVEYKYGNTSLHTSDRITSGTSATYRVPASWASNVTNAKTMTVTAVLHTYSNADCTNELGSNSKNFTITFADSFTPTFGTATLVQNDRLSTTVVAGKSYTKVTVTPSYKNDAYYKSGWAVYMDGTKELGSRKTGNPADGITLDKIPAFTATSKSLTIKYSVTDSRGFTATGTSSAFTAYGWVAPSITSISAYRCTSSGTVSDTGGYYKVSFSYNIRDFGSQTANNKNVKISYKFASDSSWRQSSTGELPNYSGYLELGPYALQNARDEKLEVQVLVSDSLSSSNPTTATAVILPASVFMDIMTSGDKKVGLAVGMVNTKQHTVQLGWPLELEGSGRVALDPDVGLTFYDANGQQTGQFPVDGDVGVDVDATLSVQGMAADAKAAGDALATVRSQVGSPLVASTSSAMTDRTRIYVYTGSQSGYTAGNWYYWNGSSWVSGGVYNSAAVETDTTLAIDGAPADSAAVGATLAGIIEGLGTPNRITPTWQRKTIAGTNGYESASTTRISTIEFIPAPGSPVTITPGAGLRFSLRFYTDAVYTSIITDMSTGWLSGSRTINPAAGTYFKVNVSYETDDTITLEQGENMTIATYTYSDKTLTVSGKPADAKVTGEKLTWLDKDIELLAGTETPSVTWIQGNINPDTGSGGTGVSRIHTTEYYYLASNAVTISAPSNMKFGIRVYADAAWDSYIQPESSSTWYTGTVRFDVVPGRYIRFCAGYTSDENISPSAGTDVNIRYRKPIVQESDIGELRDALDLVTSPTTPNVTWIQGNIDPHTGSGGTGVSRIHTTEYYYLESNAITISAPENYKFGIRVYEDSVWSSYIEEESSTTWYYGTVRFSVVPRRYIRFCAAYADDSEILPSAGINVTMTYRKANMSALNDVVARNDPDNMLVKLQQLKQPTRTGSSSYARDPLCLLHFSDIHGDGGCLQNICDFANYYSAYIDDIIHTGDIKQTSTGSDFTFWQQVPDAKNILNVIGNHDTLVNSDWYGWSMSKAYSEYFAPYITNWGVTYSENTTYYYKDYTTQKVRLIVLDIMHQTTAQLNWFTSTLNSARAAGMHVIAVSHGMSHWLFDSYISPWDDKPLVPTYKNGFNYSDDPADPPKDTSSATAADYPNFPWNLSDSYATAVDNFINAGGDFICWMHGHTHFKMLAKLKTHPNQLDVAVGEAGAPSYARSYVYGRHRGTKSEDNFNLIAVDTYSKILRIVKVGVNYDRAMRYVDTIGYDYGVHELI